MSGDNENDIYPEKPRSESTLQRVGTATLRFFGVMEPTDMDIHYSFYARVNDPAASTSEPLEDDVPTYDVEAGRLGRALSIRSITRSITSRAHSVRSLGRSASVRSNRAESTRQDPDIPSRAPPPNIVAPNIIAMTALPPGRASIGSSNASEPPTSTQELLPPQHIQSNSMRSTTQGSSAPPIVFAPSSLGRNVVNLGDDDDDDSEYEFYSDDENQANPPPHDAPPQYDDSQQLEMDRIRRDRELAHRLHQQDLAFSQMNAIDQQLQLQRIHQQKQRTTTRERPQRLRRPSEPVDLAGEGDQYDQNGRRKKKVKKVEELPPALKDPKVREQLQNMKMYRPWFLIICTIVQVVMMFYSMLYSYQHGYGWIQTSPFNYMIGPGSTVLIQLGAKYNYCILESNYTTRPDDCPSEYANVIPPAFILLPDGDKIMCGDLEGFCAMGGFGSKGIPNQWFRFITAIFLHGGVLHLLMNLLFQVRAGFDIERTAGFFRIFLIYMSSGIFGFVLAAIFSPETPTVGASGAIYGLVALLLVDLIQNWKIVVNPKKRLAILLISIFFSLAIGVIPYLDNWAHIGGFFMGLVSGVIFMPTINFGKWDARRKKILVLVAIPIYIAMMGGCFWILYSGIDASRCRVCTYFDCIPAIPGC